MKQTKRPDIDDLNELQILAERETLSSYPALKQEYVTIESQYDAFILNGGDPWVVSRANLDADLQRQLKGLYAQPPKGCLEFIAANRYNKSPTICLMCGGLGMGTLDHYLPKDIYPEFSLFSANLIPACNCNSLRGTKYKGHAAPQRVIHPYFDAFVVDRLYQSKFIGDFETPTITIEMLDENHPHKDTIKFHLEEVIENDSSRGWFDKYWVDLTLRPDDILDLVLPTAPMQLKNGELLDALTKYRNAKDREFGTPNNWYSIFYTGLLNDLNRVTLLSNAINGYRTP
jgi:hypothetical protein